MDLMEQCLLMAKLDQVEVLCHFFKNILSSFC